MSKTPAEGGGTRPSQRKRRSVASGRSIRGDDSLSPRFVEENRPRESQYDRNTAAEYRFYSLPGRFQDFAEEYLFDTDRMLGLVPWTERVMESRWERVRRCIAPEIRALAQGVVLLTDRYLLLLRDDAGMTGGLVAWGYAVHVTAIERLASIETLQRDDARIELRIALKAEESASCEWIGWGFAAESSDEVAEFAALLGRFIPTPWTRQPRLPGNVVDHRHLMREKGPVAGRQRARPEALGQEPDRLRLQEALDAAILRRPAPDGAARRLRCHGFTLDEAGHLQLLGGTQENLYALTVIDGDVKEAVWALSGVTSLRLRRSVLGREMGWTTGDGQAGTASFPVLALPQCLALFAMLRQTLTLLPVEARGPDLP
jgi:hypothetical protein